MNKCNALFAESRVEYCLELNFRYVDYQTLMHLSYSAALRHGQLINSALNAKFDAFYLHWPNFVTAAVWYGLLCKANGRARTSVFPFPEEVYFRT